MICLMYVGVVHVNRLMLIDRTSVVHGFEEEDEWDGGDEDDDDCGCGCCRRWKIWRKWKHVEESEM